MDRSYWFGLSFFFIGLALWNLPTGDYRLFTTLAGTLVQLAGVVLMARAFFKARREKGKLQAKSRWVFIVVTIAALIAGLVAGFLLVGIF